jgi:uncharacterized protein (DUF2336 family)
MNQRAPIERLAGKPGLNPRDALDILDIRTAAPGGTTELARRTDAGPDVLLYLAVHGAPATRAAVAANPASPAIANRALVDDDNEDVRAELAVKIARLMPGLSERESSHIFALTIETLECLARDAAARVRAILAEEIKSLDCIPRDIVLRLARDLHVAVATPILQYSPLLSDADLIEIIACGQVQQVLTAIAGRNPVSEPVCDRLVQSLDVSAVAALLVNPDSKIRKTRWIVSWTRPRRSMPGICRWRCAPTCRPAPSGALAAWWALPSWKGWRRASICPMPPASI